MRGRVGWAWGRMDRRGVTLVELLVVLAVVGILAIMLLPAVSAAREAARRAVCLNRLRQLGVGLATYETARGRFPPGRELPDWSLAGQVRSIYSNYRNVSQSGVVSETTGFRSVQLALLPFVELQAVYDGMEWSRPLSMRMTSGGRPYNASYAALTSVQDEFLCPSDVSRPVRPTDNSYRYNFGGSTPYAGANSPRLQSTHDGRLAGLSVQGNGAFTMGEGLSAGEFTDGLSHTVFFSERTRGSGRRPSEGIPTRADVVTMPDRSQRLPDREAMFQACGKYQPVPSPFHFTSTGSWLPEADFSNGWPFGGYASTMYNHVAPPNWSGYDCGSWSAIADTPGEHAIVSARSEHPGLVQAAYGDGRAEAVSDGIDVELWRRLGGRSDERP